jgi:DNA-directed RNA polymerase specialized sigma24 family protein
MLTRLARAAQQDNVRALDTLLGALRPAFASFFARRMPHDVAEDLTQAALMRVAQDLQGMHPPRVTQRLRTIARRLLRDEQLRLELEGQRHAPASWGEDVHWPVDLERCAEYDELVQAVRRACIQALPSDLHSVVQQVLSGRNISEIAVELGRDPAVVRELLFRARVILRRELRQYVSH